METTLTKPIQGESTELVNLPTDQSPADSLLLVIAKAASDPNCDVDKMERLLDMKERVLNKDAEMAANQALHAFQLACPQLNKTKAIAFKGRVQSKYCSYEEMMRTVRPIMKGHGFSERFDTGVDDIGAICSVTCTISHSQGHSWQSTFPVSPDMSGNKNAIQAVGSALSYGKRYAFAAAMGIVFKDEDDDGGPQGIADMPEMKMPGNASDVESQIQEAEIFFADRGFTDEQVNQVVQTLTKGKDTNWRELPTDRMAKFIKPENLENIASLIEAQS